MEKVAEHMKWNQRLSSFIITNTELFFYRLGCIVALNPKSTILLTVSVVLLSLTGFLRFHQEKNPLKLWVPQNSSFVSDSEWLMKTFEKAYRIEQVILEAPDVLTPEVFKQLAKIDKEVKTIVSPSGYRYKDLCLVIPKVSPTDELIRLVEFSCDLLDFLANTCLEQNILELWDYREKEIEKITKEDILEKVNKYKSHPVFSNLIIYEDLLGGIERNNSGHIISATHLHTVWFLKVNYSAIDITQFGNNAGTAEFASEECLEWELTYLEHMAKLEKNLSNLTMFYSSARSFGDISNETMFQDYDILTIGVVVVGVYFYLVISRCNWIEGRLYILSFALLSIVFAFIVGCSLAFLIGTSWGPVHVSLPFLLLGIGIDDIFVILSCLDNLNIDQKKLPMHERVGTMLKHAGASISITTLTDVAAFLIGSTTVLPSLHSYCIFAAFSLIFTFIFTCTFFIACVTFEIRREADNRNCCFPCKRHPDYKKNECSQRTYSKIAFEFVYSRIILTWPGKFFVLLIVGVSTGISIQGILNLKQKFDPVWFIPSHTYMFKYHETQRAIYPYLGYEGTMYIGAVNYTYEFRNIKALSDALENYDDIIYNTNSWAPEYEKFVLERYNKDISDVILPEEDFHLYLSEFLFRNGSKFQQNFKFVNELKCGEPASKIEVSGIDFRFRIFPGPEKHVPAMRKMLDLAKGNNFTTGDRRAFVWSYAFTIWIPDEIIYTEVARNLVLALVCVMSCTIILIADLYSCFWIFICVMITMVNVAGFMHLWGITIDVTSCIALQLAVGLCVDYATHIGYTFLTIVDGNRNKRALTTVITIGSAVLSGGLSTLIAILLLGASDAYAFQIFFKLFLLVSVFGLYNGLVFLPVILSWLGPAPYKSHQALQQNEIVLY
ncbi:hypothetical protein Trydic_g18553 [Trypoxylus dichotomus]